MKKIITLFTFLSLFIVSCTKTEVVPPTMNDRTITISATMPTGEESRVNYTGGTSEQRSITLKWESTDKLQLCFVHDGKYYHTEAAIVPQSISQDGKSAKFQITLPEKIPTDAPFTLYAVYQQTDEDKSNGGHFEANTAKYVLENNEESCLTLDKKSETKSNSGIIRPVLKSIQEKVTVTTLKTISFEHQGWIMALHLKNNTSKTINLPEILQLEYHEESSTSFIYNGYPATYLVNVDLSNNKIFSGSAKQDFVLFDIAHSSCPKQLESGKSITLYRWLMSTHTVEALDAYTYPDNAAQIATTVPLKSKEVKNGTVYHLYLVWSENSFEWGL